MLVSAIHQHESTTVRHMSPSSWTSLPPFTPSHCYGLSQSPGLSSLSHSKLPLAGCFTQDSVYVSMLLSPFVTHFPYPPPSAACQQVCSLGPSLYYCPENRFIITIFLDFIYIYIYVNIWYLFSSFLTSLCIIGTRFSQLIELTQMCSFLWLNNIPLYICTTASLSIQLLMDISVVSMS